MPSLFTRTPLAALALVACLALASCDTAEKRAEEHYQNSLSLLEEGDVDRALVELRNVFKLNGLHRDARLTYAEVMRDRGEYQEAYSHYLLLSEQFPDDPVSRKWLFRLAMFSGNFEEAKKHGDRALRVAADDPEVQAIGAIIAYQTAVNDGQPEARREAAASLLGMADALGDVQLYLPTVVDNHIREGELQDALAAVDQLLEDDPSLEQWQQLKLQILNWLGDDEAVGAHLATLVSMFPDEPDYPVLLVRWHMSRDDAEGAEQFLRSWVETAEGEVKVDRQVQLLGFLSRVAGEDAAIAELDRLIDGGGDAPELFRAMRAGLLFDRGDREQAITQMEAIVDGAEESSEDLRDIEVNLAQMLVTVGREDDARVRIDNVLAADDGHVGALKMHAGWLIEADRADTAIVELRTALGRAPQDAEVMSLIAEAHIRNGSRDLAGEMLALAVETSNADPVHAIAYARFLMADGNYRSAETVLTEALRTSPEDLDLLGLMGRLYIETRDWRRAEQTEARLRRIESDSAAALADALKVDRLRNQERSDEALRFLTELALSGEGNDAAEVAVVRTQIEAGRFADAESFIQERLARNPDQAVMRMLLAAIYAQTNRGEEAEYVLRKLVDEDPGREIVWRTLYETKLRLGEPEEASAILSEALDALPDAPDLLWARAGELERGGDVDGAIGIYQDLYARMPNSPIVANNLASLLSTHRDDAETLDRAYTIARRLRGSDVPAFQDTYGWIAHLRGEEREAISHLEPAAKAFPEEALVQYRLGMAYSAAGQLQDARVQLETAIDLAGPEADGKEFVEAKEEIERIDTLLAAQENGN